VPLPRKFVKFSSQNVLFLRFMCPMDCSCMINFIEVLQVPVPFELKTVHWAHCRKKINDSDLRYSEVPLKGKKHLSKYWGSRPLQPL